MNAEEGARRYARAVRLLNGDGVARDERAGYEMMVEAAKDGIVDAAYEAGQCARLGRGCAKDERLAYGFYRVAADGGHAQAAFSAAALAGRGALGEPAHALAAELYALAAERGHAGAAHNLGIMFAKGAGAPPDAAKARAAFERAVELGSEQALFSLGLLFLIGGPGLAPDPVEALKWAFLSQARDPSGPGPKLAERAAAACDDDGRAEARRRADAVRANW